MRAPLLILCLSLIALPVAAIARQSPPTDEVKRLQGEFRDERARALRLRAEGGGFAIDVMDRGPGIPEQAQKSLFRPFFTNSSHG
ncbi:MAG TPA: hypothetical protein PLR59_13475, partial [Brevundimonas sp.]|nr:hypothetical protein [Brevundimonas sp.]